MPKTEREKRLEKAYQNIKEITGLQFDETNLQEVNNALNTIYINGKNVFADKDWRNINQVNIQRVEELSRLLTRAMDVSNTSFVSIMKRDDVSASPYTIPYTFALDSKGERIKKITPQIQEQMKKKQAAIAEYEEHFGNTRKGSHGEKLAELREAVKGNVTGREKYQKVQDFFEEDFVTPEGGIKGLDGNSFAMAEKPSDLVNVCSLVLMGRGYTEADFEQNTEELQNARKQVGAEVRQLMTGNLDKEAKKAAFRELMDDATAGVGTLQLRAVDFSDDSTFDNYQYNQWIAGMVKSLYGAAMAGMSDLTRDPDTITNVKDLKDISSSLDGINKLDRIRLVPEYGSDGQLRSDMAQVVIDRLGADYGRYHITMVKNLAGAQDIARPIADFTENLILNSRELEYELEEIQEDRQKLERAEDELSADNLDEIYKLRAALKEKQTVYDVSKALIEQMENGSKDGIRKALNQYLNANPQLLDNIDPQLQTIADGTKMKEEGVSYFHYPEGKDRSVAGYRQRMTAAYDVGGQMDRISTIASLTVGYACLKEKQQAEKARENGLRAFEPEPFSLTEYLEDAEMQEANIEEAFAYFEANPIHSKSTDEADIAANHANVRKFGEIVAALQDKILDTELPGSDYGSFTEVARVLPLIKSLNSVCQDSHQFLQALPNGYEEDFYAAVGGKEAFESKWVKIQAAQSLMYAEQLLKDPDRLGKKSSRELVKGDTLLQQCISINFIKKYAQGLTGIKIGNLNVDEKTAQAMDTWSKFIKGVAQQPFHALMGTKQGLEQIMEYIRTFGKNDPGNIKKVLDDAYLMITAPEKYAEQLAKEQKEAAEQAQKEAVEQAQKEAAEQAQKEAAEQAAEQAQEAPAEQKNEDLEQALYGEAEALHDENADVEPEALDFDEHLNGMTTERLEFIGEEPHDWLAEYGTEESWSKEVSPADEWRNRIEELRNIMNEAETSWMTNGREEFRDIQTGLDEAARLLAGGDLNIGRFGKIMDNVLKRADDYIERKEREGVKGITGERRFEAVKNIRGKLITANTDALEPEMISALFGHDPSGRELTQQEMFENCMSRIAVYLETAEAMEDPAKQQEMYDTLEKVLIDRGKNSEARNKLLSDIQDGDNIIRSKALESAQRESRLFQKNLGGKMVEATERIKQEKIIAAGEKLRKLAAQKCISSGISEKSVVWSKLLNAYDTLAGRSVKEEIRNSVNSQKEIDKLSSKTIIKYGETCAKALEAGYNRDKAVSYTEQEAVAIASAAVYTNLMKTEYGRIALNGAMKYYDDEKLEHFVKGLRTGTFKMVEEIRTETDPQKRAGFTKAKNLETLGRVGAREFSLALIAEEANRLGERNSQLRAAKNNIAELNVGEGAQRRSSLPQPEVGKGMEPKPMM